MAAKVIVEVAGGNVQNVYSEVPIEVVIIDWDNIAAGDCPPEEKLFADGTTAEFFVRTRKSAL